MTIQPISLLTRYTNTPNALTGARRDPNFKSVDEHLSWWWMGRQPQGPIKLTCAPYLCFWFVFRLCVTLVWQVEITSRQDPSIRQLMPLPPSSEPEGVAHTYVCVCVWDTNLEGLSLYLSIRKPITVLAFFFVVLQEKQICIFMYVLECDIIRVTVPMCASLCGFVCLWGYLQSSKPTGAKWERMTLMGCVGMCPRVVLVWLSSCCFHTAPPSSYPTLFK